MKRAILTLGNEGFGRANSGVVFGQIWLTVGTVEFPAPHWDDFAVVVVGTWCQRLVTLIFGEPQPLKIRFMEGPFAVELLSLGKRYLRIALLEERTTRRISQEHDVELIPHIDSVIEVADGLLKKCTENSWWSRDEDDLMAAVTQLRHARATL